MHAAGRTGFAAEPVAGARCREDGAHLLRGAADAHEARGAGRAHRDDSGRIRDRRTSRPDPLAPDYRSADRLPGAPAPAPRTPRSTTLRLRARRPAPPAAVPWGWWVVAQPSALARCSADDASTQGIAVTFAADVRTPVIGMPHDAVRAESIHGANGSDSSSVTELEERESVGPSPRDGRAERGAHAPGSTVTGCAWRCRGPSGSPTSGSAGETALSSRTRRCPSRRRSRSTTDDAYVPSRPTTTATADRAADAVHHLCGRRGARRPRSAPTERRLQGDRRHLAARALTVVVSDPERPALPDPQQDRHVAFPELTPPTSPHRPAGAGARSAARCLGAPRAEDGPHPGTAATPHPHARHRRAGAPERVGAGLRGSPSLPSSGSSSSWAMSSTTARARLPPRRRATPSSSGVGPGAGPGRTTRRRWLDRAPSVDLDDQAAAPAETPGSHRFPPDAEHRSASRSSATIPRSR